MKKRHLILAYYWATTFAWAGFIYFLSCIPELKTTESDWDKYFRQIAHAFVFAILMMLTYRSLLWTVRTKVKEFELRKDYDASILIEMLLLTISGLLCFIYAISDEYHQTFVETRSGNLIDVITDTTGILIAGLAMFKMGIITEIEHRFARKGWQILTGEKYYGE